MYRLILPEYNNSELELDDKVKINLNFQQTDFSHPEAVKTSYSKTINIYGTPKNDRIFEYIYNLKSLKISFDVLSNVKYHLLYNDVLFSSGYFNIDKISIKNGNHTYSITLYDTIGDTLMKLKETSAGETKTLADLTYGVDGENESYLIDHNYIVKSFNEDISANTFHNLIRAIPTYSGYYDDFDSNKVALYIDSTIPTDNFYGVKKSIEKDGKTYKTQNGWSICEVDRDLSEWEHRELRSSKQLFGINTGMIFRACINELLTDKYKPYADVYYRNLLASHITEKLDSTYMMLPKFDFNNENKSSNTDNTQINYQEYAKSEYYVPFESKLRYSALKTGSYTFTTKDSTNYVKSKLTPTVKLPVKVNKEVNWIWTKPLTTTLYGTKKEGSATFIYQPPISFDIELKMANDKDNLYGRFFSIPIIFYTFEYIDAQDKKVRRVIPIVGTNAYKDTIKTYGGGDKTLNFYKPDIEKMVYNTVLKFDFADDYIINEEQLERDVKRMWYTFSWDKSTESFDSTFLLPTQDIEVILENVKPSTDVTVSEAITTISFYTTTFIGKSSTYELLHENFVNQSFHYTRQSGDSTPNYYPKFVQYQSINKNLEISESLSSYSYTTTRESNKHRVIDNSALYVKGIHLNVDDKVDKNSSQYRNYYDEFNMATEVSSIITLDEYNSSPSEQFNSISKELLRNVKITPLDFFISMLKLFNMRLVSSSIDSILFPVSIDNYFIHEADDDNPEIIYNIDSRIDASSIEIKPTATEYKFLNYGLNYLEDTYLKKIGSLPEGTIFTNNNFNYNNDTYNYYENLSFKTTGPYTMKSVYFANSSIVGNYDFNSVNKGGKTTQHLYYQGEDSKETEITDNNFLGFNTLGLITEKTDKFPKLCFFDAEHKLLEPDFTLVTYQFKFNLTDPIRVTDDIPSVINLNGNNCYTYIYRTPVGWPQIVYDYTVGTRKKVSDVMEETYTIPKFTYFEDTYQNYALNFDKYNEEIYNDNNRVVTLKVNLPYVDLDTAQIMTRIYFFMDSFWIINKITDFNLDETYQKVEFIKINNPSNLLIKNPYSQESYNWIIKKV